MRYSEGIYARAFIEVWESAAQENIDGLIKRFAGMIKKNGDIGRFQKIIEAVKRLAVAKKGAKFVVIECARASGAQQAAALKKTFSKNDCVEEEVDPGLIAGVRVTINGERELDFSLRRRLNALFY